MSPGGAILRGNRKRRDPMTAQASRPLLPLALLAGLWLAAPAGARLILVWSNADDLTVNGNCSLREALEAAQTDQAVDACPAGSPTETDVVLLAWGPYDLHLGQLAIGPGAVIVRGAETPPRSVVRGLGASRLFEVEDGAEVAFEGLDLEAGDAREIAGQRVGGAIFGHAADIALRDVNLRANQAVSGGALYFTSAGGHSLLVERSRFEQNDAVHATTGQASGGAVQLVLGGTASARFRDTELVLNQARSTVAGASVFGGALHAALAGSAALELSRVFVASNSATPGSPDAAAWGAGLMVLADDQASVRILDSSVFANQPLAGAEFSVAALYLQATVEAQVAVERTRFDSNGGGLALRGIELSAFGSAAIRATDLLVSRGPAYGLRAFAQDTSQVDLGHLTVTAHGNTGLFLSATDFAHLELDNSIVWDNGTEVAAYGPAVVDPSNLIGVDPGFVAGGAGDFHLTAGSLAIDRGDAGLATVGPWDAGHAPRVAGDETDAGAFEFGALFGDGFESAETGFWTAAVP